MKVVIFGGTFNPVHYGHLFLAETIRSELCYDRVVFVPAYLPVHKSIIPYIDPIHRLTMLKLAIVDSLSFDVDECEIERAEPSYSIDTIREICIRYKLATKPGFIIGDDLVRNFHQWKEADHLADSTALIVAHRTRITQSNFKFPHRYIDNPLIAISSSEIRERIEAGKSVRFLLPDKVIDYIEKYKLYC